MATNDETATPEDDGKDPAAVPLGRKGGAKGGPARAALTPERRKEIARAATTKQWGKKEE